MLDASKLINPLFFIFILINPFLFVQGINNPYEFPKFIFALIISQLIAVVIFLGKEKMKIDILTKIILLYILIVFISNIQGLDLHTSIIGSVWRHQGFLLLISSLIFYLASRFYADKKLIEKCLLISSALLTIFTIVEYLLIQAGANFPMYNGRLVASLGNPNFLAAYLVLTLPFVLFLNLKNIFIKLLLTIGIIISVLITESRSSILALIIIILIFFINKIKINNYLKIFLIVFSIIFSIFIIFNFNIFERSSIWDSRTLIWESGINKIAQSSLMGFGQENFELIFPKEFNFHVDNAHNLFLETIISSGIFGLILLILIMYFGFKKVDLKYQMFLVSFLTISFFNPLFISGIILFWIILGIANKKEHVG